MGQMHIWSGCVKEYPGQCCMMCSLSKSFTDFCKCDGRQAASSVLPLLYHKIKLGGFKTTLQLATSPGGGNVA